MSLVALMMDKKVFKHLMKKKQQNIDGPWPFS
jgi:hypothetical protein